MDSGGFCLAAAAFVMAASMLGLPRKIKRLDKKIRKLYKNNGVKNDMSKLLEELVGKKCTLYSVSGFGSVGTILSFDEDWVKFEYDSKKDKKTIKILKIDDIDSFEIKE